MPLNTATALQTVRSNLNYWELPGYHDQFRSSDTQATRRLCCYWQDRLAVLLDLLGYAYVSGGKLRRYLPESHPAFDPDADAGIANMYAAETQFVMGGGWPGRDDTDSIAYHDSPVTDTSSMDTTAIRESNSQGLYVFDLTYKPVPYDMLTDDDVDMSSNTQGEFIRFIDPNQEPAGRSLPLLPLEFEDPSSPSGWTQARELAPVLFPSNMFSWRWYKVPVAYYDNYLRDLWLGTQDISGNFTKGMMGSVNLTTFANCPPGTLLGQAPKIYKYISETTDIYYDIELIAEYQPQGHNNYPRADGSWAATRLKFNHAQMGPFPSFEFAQCFGGTG